MVNQKLVDGLYAPMSRSFIALFIVTSLAFTIKKPFSEAGEEFHYVHMTFMWLAMVNFVISAPKVGNLAEVGLQHIFGSAIGAMAGAGIINAAWYAGDILRNPSWFAFGMCAIGLVANIIGWTYKIPQTGMLMVLSCSMIVFCNDKPISATLFMISRIVGMFAGVVMSLILALTVYPTAATQEVVKNLARALDALSELNHIAWSHTVQHAVEPLAAKSPSSKKMMSEGEEEGKGFIRLSAGVCKDGKCGVAQALVAAQMEKAIMNVYHGVELAEGAIPLTRKEYGVQCCGNFWVFLPGFPWSNWKSLPEQDIGNLAWSIRKCARVLWTVSLTFQNGLDEDMVETLKQHYPEGLMAKLKLDSCDTFEDFVEAFPDSEEAPSKSLEAFKTSVETLFNVDDAYRMKMTRHMQKYKNKALRAGLRSDSQLLRMATSLALRSTPEEEKPKRGGRLFGMFRGRQESEHDGAGAPLLGDTDPIPEDEDESLNNEAETTQADTTRAEMLEGRSSSGLAREQSKELSLFPSTAEGYVSMVRWYSFQFLLTEVHKDMQELQFHLNTVLKKMPSFGVKSPRHA